MFKRKPLITDNVYGKLMTSFGRVVDMDPFVARPATALADRVAAEEPELTASVDRKLYAGAAVYHLRLLAGAWIMAHEQSLPRKTAEVFEEAVAWRFGPLVKHGGRLRTAFPNWHAPKRSAWSDRQRLQDRQRGSTDHGERAKQRGTRLEHVRTSLRPQRLGQPPGAGRLRQRPRWLPRSSR